jgi:hypothetical protein
MLEFFTVLPIVIRRVQANGKLLAVVAGAVLAAAPSAPLSAR